MKNKLWLTTWCSVLLVAATRGQDAANDLKAGLTAYYPLNGTIREAGTGPKAAAQGRTLRLAPDRAGNPNGAYHFDFSSWMLVPKSPGLEPKSELTVSVWVKPDRWVAPDSQTVILTKRFDLYNAPWNSYIFALGDGRSGPGVAGGQAGQAMFCLSTMGVQTFVSGGEPLSINNWSHLAGTYDGAKICLFVNGKLVATENKSGPIDYGPFGLFIGATTDPNERFLGSLSEIRIYNRALSASEVQQLSALKPPAPYVASAASKESADANNPRGTYALVSVDGNPIPCTVNHEGHALAVKSGAFIFNSDGTCSSKMVFTAPSGVEAVNEVKAAYTRQGAGEFTMQWEGAGMTIGTLAGDTFTMNNERMIFAYRKVAVGKTPIITRVSPLLAKCNQTIVIEGSGFGDTPPKLVTIFDAADTDSRNGLSPALAIHNQGKGQHRWEAGLASGENQDLIGIKLTKWTDTKITLAGFGNCLGDDYKAGSWTWKISAGDKIEIVVFGPNNAEPVTFATTVQAGEQAADSMGNAIHPPANSVNELERLKLQFKDNPNLVFSQDANGMTPLHSAAAKGQKDLVDWLLSKDAEVNVQAKDGATPLHWAVYSGHKDVANLLLASRADVNAKGRDGYTPLHWAAAKGFKEIAELLLNHHAEVNARDSQGETPLKLAISKNHQDCAELLRQHGGQE